MNIDSKKTFNEKYNISLAKISTIIAICMSLFHLYTSTFGILEAWRHRSVHMIFILFLVAMSTKKLPEKFSNLYRTVLLVFSAIVSVYMIVNYDQIILRDLMPTFWDKVIGTILIVLIIDAARRFVGNSMAVIALLFLAYALFGYLIPGRMSAPRFTYNRLIAQLFNSTAGLLGSTTGVAATSVVMFILFGACLDGSGGSDFFSDFSLVATRKVKGGPAKASVVASALVGTIQGNAISNVVTTGTFTIPLMIRAGYTPVYAGAVEAAASTGGMIMPPVMGAAAFLLAEMTGTPYNEILIYAILPAILYYLGVFTMVHLHAVKFDIKPIDENVSLSKKEMFWQGLTCLAPMVLLVYLLLKGSSPMRSATLAMGLLMLIWIIRPVKRMSVNDFLKVLEKGAKGMLSVSSACIAAGIVVGCVSLTGLATKIAVLVGMAGANQWFVLILSMVVCIIFGMGLPVSASYVIAAITLGSVFVKVGIPTVEGHLFLMYFATISAITPPVALGSYAAAGIAKASPNKVGIQGVKLALPAFIIPYVFVFGPELMLIGQPLDIIIAIITSSIGIISLSVSMEGFLFTNVNMVCRIAFLVAALCLVVVGTTSDIIGIIIFAILFFSNLMLKRKGQTLKLGEQNE